MRWYTCPEHLPEEGLIVLGYSDVYQSYYLSKWSSCRGWLGQDNDDIRIITHWCDVSLTLPFPVGNGINEEKAKEHNLKFSSSRLFGS